MTNGVLVCWNNGRKGFKPKSYFIVIPIFPLRITNTNYSYHEIKTESALFCQEIFRKFLGEPAMACPDQTDFKKDYTQIPPYPPLLKGGNFFNFF